MNLPPGGARIGKPGTISGSQGIAAITLPPLSSPLVEALHLDRPAILEASAGTGKTYTLEHLFVRLLLQEKPPELPEILVVTFTEKATGELRQKIRQRLGMIRRLPGLNRTQKDFLDQAYVNFDEASIQTIHGFCHGVLRHYAFENKALFDARLAEDRALYQEALAEEMRSTWLNEFSSPEDKDAFTRFARDIGLNGGDKWSDVLINIAMNMNLESGDCLLPRPDPEALERLQKEISHTVIQLREAFGTRVSQDIADSSLAMSLKAIPWKNKAVKEKAPGILFQAAILSTQTLPGLKSDEIVAPLATYLDDINLRLIHHEGFTALLLPESPSFPALPDVLQHLERLRKLHERLKIQQANLRFQHHHRIIASLQEHVAHIKRTRGLLTFNDMIRQVHASVLNQPELVQSLRSAYKYCIVDEFQDTDSVQWDIFKKVFLESGGKNPLFLIGDPKQAIYGFRSADVYTYLEAREQLRAIALSGEAQGHGLSANFRSSEKLLKAFNVLFSQPEWFGAEQPSAPDSNWRLPQGNRVDYCPVGFGGSPRQYCRTGASEKESAPIVLVDLASATKVEATRRLWNGWIVAEIQNLLTGRVELRIPDDSVPGNFPADGQPMRPLRASDICVLVRTGSERAKLESQFQDAGIPFAVYKKEGLYRSEEALHLLAMLEAMEDPGEERSFRRALLSQFFQVAPENLASVSGGNGSISGENEEHGKSGQGDGTEIATLFEKWNRLATQSRWRRLFHSLLYDTGLLYRICALPDGDRRVMNYLQLTQNLTQEAMRKHFDLSTLLDWYRRRRRSEGNSEEAKDHFRLESERDLVQIMTMHISKGLEFPVVFLAGGFSAARKSDYLQFKRRGAFAGENGRTGGTVFHLDNQNQEAIAELERQDLEEVKRLYYVALTRAKYRLYLPLVPEPKKKNGEEKKSNPSPLLHLVGASLRGARQQIPELFYHVPADETQAVARASTQLDLQSEAKENPTTSLMAASPPTDPPLPSEGSDFSSRRMVLESYSHLAYRLEKWVGAQTEGRYEKEEAPPDWESDSEGQETGTEETNPGQLLPRGTHIGNALHNLFEKIDFALAAQHPSPRALGEVPQVRDLIGQSLEQHKLPPDCREGVEHILWNTLRAPLPALGSGAPFRLCDVTDMRPELEFLFPYGEKAAGAIPEVRSKHGYLWGFIDLVFRHAGRFYVLDWKSNYLDDYAPAALAENMRQSRYDLQYTLYTVAVIKWLKSVIADFDYERDFGGVLYIYLRGMRAEEGKPGATGVFAHRPNSDEALRGYPALLEQALRAPLGLAKGENHV